MTNSTASTTATTSAGAGGGASNVDRGPTSVPVDGDPNGLFWDATTNTLLIADNDNNRVLQWTDAGGVGLLADLPGGEQDSSGLGQVVKTADGTVAVTRFGFGTTGGVALVAPDLSTSLVPNIDPTKRRIGLCVAPDGSLYDSYFETFTGTDTLGAVGKLDLSGTEVDIITSLEKPVGVIVVGENLVVDDQMTNEALTTPVASPSSTLNILAQLDEPDLLCEGPNGTIFSGGAMGDVRQIASDGTVTTFAGGFLSIRGVAYDAANERLFAAEHDSTGAANTVRILPVD